MSTGESPPPASRPALDRLGDSVREGAWVISGLLVLSAIGIGVTSLSAQYGFWYWAMMVPLFGVACLLADVSRARLHGRPVATEVRNQILHWVGTVGALEVVFLLQTRGTVGRNAGGLIALLVLALATFLAGIRSDWRFTVAGVLMGAAAAGAAFVDQFLWMAIIPIAGGLFLFVYLARRPSSH